MGTILSSKHLTRFKEIAQLFWRHGRSDMFHQWSQLAELKDEPILIKEGTPSPEELVRDLEKMGPTFIKLGQILSTRADLLPEPYLKALARLQDNVEPFPYAQVERIVEEELGVRMSKAFSDFETKPLAAASLGQVHRAALRDGREVVVKVQRPEIRQKVAEDLEVLEEIASFADEHTDVGRRHRFSDILEQFRKTIIQELDFKREATNLAMVAENIREFDHICVAEPIPDYTSRSVITMTYMQGYKITKLSPVARLDVSGAMLADELFQAYLKQVLVDGLFHADPHPGNVLLTQDGKIGLLDLGMVGRVTPGMQESLIRLLLAISEGRAEAAVDEAIRISETTDNFDEVSFRRQMGDLVVQMQRKTLHRMDIGRMLLEVSRSAGETGLFVPSELTLLGKTLMQLHEIGQCLEPTFDPNAAVREHVNGILHRRLRKDWTPGNLFSSLLEVKNFVGQLPNRVNKVFDVLGKGQIELKLRTDDTLRILDGFQKVANRITAGLVLAALIIGAALLMRVETTFKLFGYPGLAILCFVGAAAGGVFLLVEIFFSDTKRPPNPPT